MTIRLFFFALMAFSTSELLSRHLEPNRAFLKGATRLLSDSSVPLEELRNAFTRVLEPFMFEPIEIKYYGKALEEIINFRNRQESASPEEVRNEFGEIKTQLVEKLRRKDQGIKKHLAESASAVVLLMKRELVWQLRQKKGDLGAVKVTDRVAELKSIVRGQISELHEAGEIPTAAFREILDALGAEIPDKHPAAVALIEAFSENADLFTRPEFIIQLVLRTQIGQIESDLAALKDVSGYVVNRVKAIFFLLTQFSQPTKNELLVITELLDDLTEIARDPSEVFGPKTKPETVKKAQLLLGELVHDLERMRSGNRGEFSGETIDKVSEHFHTFLNRFGKQYIPILRTHLPFELNFACIGFDQNKVAKCRKVRKYRNVIVSNNLGSRMAPKDIKNFSFKDCVDLSDTEIAALNLLTEYFDEDLPVKYHLNEFAFYETLTQLIEFISTTDQETLDKANFFRRFEQHLAGGASESEGHQELADTKWHRALWRVANFLQAGAGGFSLTIEPLAESSKWVFTSQTETGLFHFARREILGLLIAINSAEVQKITAELQGAENSLGPRTSEAAKRLEALSEQIGRDQQTLSGEAKPFSHDIEELLERVADVLVLGFTLGAEKEVLI